MMGQFEQLDQMLTAQEGMLRTSQVVSSGISKPVFYDYVRSRDLDRVAHGIYLSKDSWVDAMYLLTSLILNVAAANSKLPFSSSVSSAILIA